MPDILRFNKKELQQRLEYRCVHRHDGVSHSKCYDTANNITEKIAFFDLETEDLNADYGIIFCWAVGDQDGKIYTDHVTTDDIKKYKSSNRNVHPKEDTRIVKSLLDHLANYDRVCGHFSCGFDLPFLRTRAVICGVDFPAYGTLNQSDTWVMLKKKFKLSRNSLENGCRNLLGVTNKDRLSLSIKHGVLRGEQWAINDTLEHCKRDIIDLRNLYNKINKYSNHTKTSI